MIKMIQIVSLALSMFFLARYWLLCLRIKNSNVVLDCWKWINIKVIKIVD